MFSIGIDIGGMSIKVGLVSANGEILVKNKKQTANTPEKCISNMIEQIKKLLTETNVDISQISGIGIGCPGSVFSDTGIVDNLPNLNGWVDVKLKEELQKVFNLPIKISNDANVALLAEVKYGLAKDCQNAVMFTLGTGVGGGIVADGKLIEGGWSHGAELGHSTLVLDGLECTCGRRGCIERYVSATALMEQTKEQMLKDKNSLMWQQVNGDIESVDGLTAFECEKKGDLSAKIVVDNYVKYLSESILSMLNIFRPEIFILGGGVSGQGENLRKRVVGYLEKYSYGYPNAPKTEIKIASLGNDAGIIGASALI